MLAKSRGDRGWEELLSLMLAATDLGLGEWDHALEQLTNSDAGSELVRMGRLPLLGAHPGGARRGRGPAGDEELADELGAGTNSEFAFAPGLARAIALNAFGRHEEALQEAMEIAVAGPGVANEDRREAYMEAGAAALAIDNQAALERLIQFVAELPPAMRSPLLRASAARFAALLAGRRGDERIAEDHFDDAVRELRGIEAPFVLAQVLLEQAELLYSDARVDEAQPLANEATDIFLRLRATPWLERARSLTSRAVA